MSGASEALSRKRAGALDLQGVVSSMKALAASSIDQYEKAVESLEDYSRAVQLGLSVCLRDVAPSPDGNEPRRRGPQAVGAVIFGSDQGLVGGFNEVLAEFALASLRALPGPAIRIWAVGERIAALLNDVGLPPPSVLPVPNSIEAIAPLVGELLIQLEAARERGELLEVYVYHNHPKGAATYEPASRRLLPLDEQWRRSLLALAWPTHNLPQVVQGPEPALRSFIREYLFVLLFQTCAQSLASENASRLASMQRAEKNIEGILEDLNRRFHRLRQESIDQELFEVISGYEALSSTAVQGGSGT
jgi:F-type H+-transporting ATPase subunit gamma